MTLSVSISEAKRQRDSEEIETDRERKTEREIGVYSMNGQLAQVLLLTEGLLALRPVHLATYTIRAKYRANKIMISPALFKHF